MRYERAAVSREAVKLCQPIRTLSFVRLGTVTSGLQVCSFPWDVLCSQAAGAEPTTLAASVLPARWRPCHYAIVFISGHILSAEMTSGTGNLEPKAKLNWPGESFMSIPTARLFPCKLQWQWRALDYKKLIKAEGQQSGPFCTWQGLQSRWHLAGSFRL